MAELEDPSPGAGSPALRHALVVMNLSFSYTPHVAGSEVLRGVRFKVPVGARVVLVGLNGAGKSTLLSILAGARMCPEGAVTVLGEDAFRGPTVHRRIVLVSAEWTAAVGGMSSASAAELMAAAVERAAEEQRAATAERGRRLAELLGVDAGWQVFALSEGQRRRLHLVIKLMPLYEVALLDEATTDLDIVARRNLLLFLRHDSAARRATVIYCTHIFDGLEGWASHMALVEGARLARLDNCLSVPALSHAFAAGRQRPLSSPPAKHSKPDPAASSMYEVVRAWLKKGAPHAAHTPADAGAHAPAAAEHPGRAPGEVVAAVHATNLWWGWGSGASVWGGQKYVLRGLNCSVAAGRSQSLLFQSLFAVYIGLFCCVVGLFCCVVGFFCVSIL